jgi:hypothetical protein
MQNFKGTLLRQFDSNATGNVETGSPITVRNQTDDTLATIYSDNGITEKDNPFISDAQGEYNFFAANGVYKIEIGSPVVKTEENVNLFDQSDFDTLTEAPFDDTPYVRRDGIWVPATSSEGGGLKVGDYYASASGPRDPVKDLELNGQGVSSALYPDLVGLPGYTVNNDPTGITGTPASPVEILTPTTGITQSSTREVFINIDNTAAVYYSLSTSGSTDLNISYSLNNVVDLRITLPNRILMIRNSGPSNLLYACDATSGVYSDCVFYGIVDPLTGSIIPLNSISGIGAINPYAMAGDESGDVIVFANKASAISYSFDGGSSFSVIPDFKTVSTNNIVQIEYVNGFFYIFCGNFSGFAGQPNILEVYRTSDFINFDNMTSFMPISPLARVVCSDSLFLVGSGLSNFNTSDFENFNAIALRVQISQPVCFNIYGTSNCFITKSGTDVRISFDGGVTESALNYSPSDYFGKTMFFDGLNINYLTGASGDNILSMPAILNLGGIITIPEAASDISGAKYYVKGIA